MLYQQANEIKAAGAKAYMKNQFDFIGLTMKQRRDICKLYTKQNELAQDELETVVRELWALPERDFQYFAIELLAFYKKQWKPSIIKLFEYIIVHKSWWDTVDFIAAECTGVYFKHYPDKIETITGRWNAWDNIWLQRSSLLFQKNYKAMLDTELLSKYILRIAGSKEFFVQKAIGWVLREYAKTNEAWVRNFVNENKLAPLSKREALKHLH